MNLQEPQSGTTILQGNNPTPTLPTRGGRGVRSILLWSAIEFSDFLQGIVEDEDVVGHIRRDPHQRISMDSLQ